MRKKRVELVTRNLGYGKVLAGRNKLKRKLLAKSKFAEIGNTRVHHGGNMVMLKVRLLLHRLLGVDTCELAGFLSQV